MNEIYFLKDEIAEKNYIIRQLKGGKIPE